MKQIEVKEVIVSTLAMRGEGVAGDPVRAILQVYDKSGELIAERDPQLEALPKTVDGLRNFFAERTVQSSRPVTAFQHELDVAMRYLQIKMFSPTLEGIMEQKHIDMTKVVTVMAKVRQLTFIEWIKNEHNQNCPPLEKINTEP